MIALAATGFIQVLLVTFQTWLIARERIGMVFGVGFLISLTWTFNVKRVALGGWPDRIAYATGAGCGALAGLLVARGLTR